MHVFLFCCKECQTLLGYFETQDAADLAQLRLICTSDAAEFNANRAYTGMGQHCHMPAVCRHIYTHALIGASAQHLLYTSFHSTSIC